MSNSSTTDNSNDNNHNSSNDTKKKYYQTWYGIPLTAFFVLLIFLCFLTAHKTVYAIIDNNFSHKSDTIVINYVPVSDSTLNATAKSDKVKSLTAKVDSIDKIVNHIDEQYQSNIDINLEKINGWIGFWLALISIIVAITAFWQIYKQHKLEEEAKEFKKEVKEDIDKVKDGLKDEVKENIDVLNNKISENEARLKRMTIIHLAQSIAQIPDPRYVPGNIEKKDLCKQFLSSLCDALSEYINILSKNLPDKIVLLKADFYKLSIMLVHLGYATTMILSLYSSRKVNVKLTKVREEINSMILNANGKGMSKDSVIEQLQGIHAKLMEITKE